MARVTSNFNTPPFKKFTLATVTLTWLASTLRCSAQNKASTLDRTCRQLQDNLAIKNQDTCSLSARNVAMWTRRLVLLAAVNPEAIHVRFCAENGADAVVLQSVDQSVLAPTLPSQQTKECDIVGQINLANNVLRNTPRRLLGLQNLLNWAQPFFRGSASTV
jgi:hypothetical protein